MDQERHRRRIEFMKKQAEEDRHRDSDASRLNSDIVPIRIADENSVRIVSENVENT